MIATLQPEKQQTHFENLIRESQTVFIKEIFGDDYSAFGVESVMVQTKTQFQQVQILETSSYGKALYLDGAIQSAEYDEYIYHEALIHPAMVNLKNVTNVLILGGGEGASVREALRYPNVECVDMVDIDGELIEFCRKHLPDWSDGAFRDNRLHVHVDDALLFVDRIDKTYDLIVMDLVDEFSCNTKNDLVERIYSTTFFSKLKSHLGPEGALVIQSSEFNQGEFESFAHIYRTISPLFSFAEVYNCFVPSFTADWGFILCNDQQPFAALTPDIVNANISRKLIFDVQAIGEEVEELEFYDGLTHQRMFSLPKDLRQLIADDFIEREDFPTLCPLPV